MREFDTDLLDSGGLIKSGYGYLNANGGKIVAIITLAIATLVTFTDVSFLGHRAENFATTLGIMLIASYLMFFSLEDAGEKLYEGSEDYLSAKEEYRAVRERILPSDVPALREFCTRYSLEELDYRRASCIAEYGYSYEEYDAYRKSKNAETRRAKRCFSRCERMRAHILTPVMLLSGDRRAHVSELCDPESYKPLVMIANLIPSTLAMTFTVSVMLTAKDGLTAGGIIDGLMKLSALPIVGFRGYAEGYSFSKNGKAVWLVTKKRLLETFLTEKAAGKFGAQNS